ncbi:hypothetical protein DCC85_01195 [Paenibacillus sp. CAA11]|uniref:sensor histidine kinase n=1 Tax=Paenibacillus sp. CAA11 TaxID=1532905 RepID=UPI000D390EE2|nr:sensor histidine kinase [Paenibacillus sp. CAA11]AWB42980.1 hypothetical protein DCC85_01195 [Paenibacillus sp. CAA11]
MDNFLIEELFYSITFISIPFIIHYFYKQVFGTSVFGKSLIFLGYSLYYMLSLTLHFSPLSGALTLCLNIGLILLCNFLYKGQIAWKMGIGFVITVVIILTDTAVLAQAQDMTGYIFTLFFSKFLIFIFLQMILRLAQFIGEGHLSKWYWMILFLCPLFSIIGIHQISANPWYRLYPAMFPVLSGSLLFINLLVLVLCDRILRIQSAHIKNSLLEQQNAYYIHQYLVTKSREEEMRRFQHDFKNILLGLRSQLKSGNETTSMKQLDALLGTINETSECCNTGSIIIDSIINYKQRVARELNIPVHLDIQIPPSLQLDSIAMSIILGNILDNAIDACRKISGSKPYINIYIHYMNDSLFIKVVNPYTHKIIKNHKGLFISNKQDKSRHGLGLNNIKKVVEDLQGLWDISYENQIFQIEIVLFQISLNSQSIESRLCNW